MQRLKSKTNSLRYDRLRAALRSDSVDFKTTKGYSSSSESEVEAEIKRINTSIRILSNLEAYGEDVVMDAEREQRMMLSKSKKHKQRRRPRPPRSDLYSRQQRPHTSLGISRFEEEGYGDMPLTGVATATSQLSDPWLRISQSVEESKSQPSIFGRPMSRQRRRIEDSMQAVNWRRHASDYAPSGGTSTSSVTSINALNKATPAEHSELLELFEECREFARDTRLDRQGSFEATIPRKPKESRRVDLSFLDKDAGEDAEDQFEIRRMDLMRRMNRVYGTDIDLSLDCIGIRGLKKISLSKDLRLADIKILKRLFHAVERYQDLGRDAKSRGIVRGLTEQQFVEVFSQAFVVPPERVSVMFQMCDSDGNGILTCDEFLTFVVEEGFKKWIDSHQTHGFEQLRQVSDHRHPALAQHIIRIPERNMYLTSSLRTLVHVWDATTLRHTKVLAAPSSSRFAVISRGRLSNKLQAVDRGMIMHGGKKHEQQLPRNTSRIKDLCYCPTTDRIVVAMDNTLYKPVLVCYSARTLLEDELIPLPETPSCVAVDYQPARERDCYVVGYASGKIGVYGIKEKKWIKVMQVHSDAVTKAKSIPIMGVRQLVSVGLDGWLQVQDMNRLEYIWSGHKHVKGINSFAHSPTWSLLVTGSVDRTVRLWNMYVRECVGVVSGHLSAVVAVEISDMYNHIVSLSLDKMIRVWDIRTMGCFQVLRDSTTHRPEDELSCMMFDPEANRLVTAGSNIGVWPIDVSIAMQRRQAGDPTHSRAVIGTRYSRGFDQFVSVDIEGCCRVWSASHGTTILEFFCKHDGSAVTAMTLDQMERRLATGSHSGVVKVWNFNTAEELCCVDVFKQEVTSMFFLPAACTRPIIAGSWDHHVALVPDQVEEDSKDEVPPHYLMCHTGDVLAIENCERRLATGGTDGYLAFWQIADGHVSLHPKCKLQTPAGVHGAVPAVITALIFLPRLQVLMVGLQDGSIHMAHPMHAQFMAENILVAGDSVCSMATDSKCRFLVTGDLSGYAKMWRITSIDGKAFAFDLVREWSAHHPGSLISAAYCIRVDGFLTSGADGFVRIWDTKGDLLATLGQKVEWPFPSSSFVEEESSRVGAMESLEDTRPNASSDGNSKKTPSLQSSQSSNDSSELYSDDCDSDSASEGGVRRASLTAGSDTPYSGSTGRRRGGSHTSITSVSADTARSNANPLEGRGASQGASLNTPSTRRPRLSLRINGEDVGAAGIDVAGIGDSGEATYRELAAERDRRGSACGRSSGRVSEINGESRSRARHRKKKGKNTSTTEKPSGYEHPEIMQTIDPNSSLARNKALESYLCHSPAPVNEVENGMKGRPSDPKRELRRTKTGMSTLTLFGPGSLTSELSKIPTL
eukprot:Rmarinus@m.13474